MPKLMLALKIIELISARRAAPTITNGADCGVTPVIPTTVAANIAPIMNTSPCAKLISSTMP